MTPVDAMRLVGEDLAMEGDPQRNLATFVTTWMEPEAQRIIAENLHRNFIDHAEYPISAEIEQRCVRMLADLFHAPGPTTGCRTQGSSEAIMLGALSLKWKWRERRAAAGGSVDRPNLVFGADVHVVWEKFCRYFDVERGSSPSSPTSTRSAPTTSSRISTRTRSEWWPSWGPRSPGTRTTSSASTTCSCGSSRSATWTSRSTSTGRAGASCGRSSTPTRSGTSVWSRSARSTSPGTSTARVSGHRLARVP